LFKKNAKGVSGSDCWVHISAKKGHRSLRMNVNNSLHGINRVEDRVIYHC